VADEVVGPNFAELWISLDDKADYAGSVARIQATVDGYPGLYRDVQTYLQERMKEVLTGASGAIVVRIYGTDLATLRSKADEVGKALKGVSGVSNLKVEPQVLVPQIEIALHPSVLQRVGLSPAEVRKTMATLLRGTRVGEVYRGDQVVEVVVWGDARLRADVTAVRDLRIALPSGGDARLSDLATVTIAPAPNVVLRDGASRRIDVTCDARGRDLGAVARDVEQAVRALPFALVGGVLGVLVTGGIVSLGSLVGLVTVLGIAARNGIMLVSHYRHLEREEGMTFGEALVVRGAVERVAPILMTALATGLALVPLAISGNRPGNEIEHPMAVVILGGLVTSTIRNLLVVPALYLRFGRNHAFSVSP
jgi:Cu/Ag efflux pump CusA